MRASCRLEPARGVPAVGVLDREFQIERLHVSGKRATRETARGEIHANRRSLLEDSKFESSSCTSRQPHVTWRESSRRRRCVPQLCCSLLPSTSSRVSVSACSFCEGVSIYACSPVVAYCCCAHLLCTAVVLDCCTTTSDALLPYCSVAVGISSSSNSGATRAGDLGVSCLLDFVAA